MIADFKPRVLKFLDHQRGRGDGYFKFSYSGDFFGEETRWGLDASALAAKIYQMLGAVDDTPREFKENWLEFLKSFGNKNGEIYDPLIVRSSALRKKLSAFRHGYFGDFSGQETKRAETRQAFAAIRSLGGKPDFPYRKIPREKKAIDTYIEKLNWRRDPWGAGSHVSHLLFFLKNNQVFWGEENKDLIDYVVKKINERQSSLDGSWHANPSLPNHQKVNAAMKVISGLAACDVPRFAYPEKLIDLCLAVPSDAESCSQVDRIYVIYYASQLTGHRSAEISAFAERKMELYEKNFRPEGGFSFYPEKAQNYYYGARVSRGLNEPDIHGTILGVWGVVMLAKLLKLPEGGKLHLPII